MTTSGTFAVPARRRAARHVLIRNGSRGRAVGWAPRAVPTDAPWERRHLVRLAVWILVGLVGLGVSWFRVSGEGDWHDQLPWLVVGVVVLAISGLGTAGWLMAASRVVHLEGHDVMSQLHRQQLDLVGIDVLPVEPASSAAGPASQADTDGPVVYVTGEGMTRVHTSTCLLVAGKAVSPVDAGEAAARALQPCGVCCG